MRGKEETDPPESAGKCTGVRREARTRARTAHGPHIHRRPVSRGPCRRHPQTEAGKRLVTNFPSHKLCCSPRPRSAAAFHCCPASPGLGKVNLLLRRQKRWDKDRCPKMPTLPLCSCAILVQDAGWPTHGVTPSRWQRYGLCTLNKGFLLEGWKESTL